MQTEKIISSKAVIPAYIATAALYLVSLNCSPLLQAILKVFPLAILIAALALQRREELRTIVWALIFCLLGDIAGEAKILFGDNAFLAQIALFIVAHILYTVFFNRYRLPKSSSPRIWKIAAQVALMIFAVAMAAILFYSIDSTAFKIAVGFYICILLCMALFAVAQNRPNCWMYAVGAAFFTISDGLIALYEFVVQFPHRHLMVMATYFVALLFINMDLLKKS